jgi:glucose-specific phosphotransferase system IIA component
MFNLFKKKEVLYSPAKGTCKDISEVSDPAFSQKLLGDGLAVVPKEGTLYAPCSGTLTVLFPTGHAFGIQTSSGAEVLVHAGLDTVFLEGKGFDVLKQKGDKVRAGDPVVHMNLDVVKSAGYDCTVMLVVTNPGQKVLIKHVLSGRVDQETILMSLQEGG